MEKIKNEQVATRLFKAQMSDRIIECKKGFLLLNVVGFEEFVDEFLGEDTRPRTMVDTMTESFVIVMHWPDFRDLWFSFMEQDKQMTAEFNLISN